MNGYSNPWPGGGGKNKYPNAFNGIYTGITYEAMDNGKVHASGTVTAASWQNLAETFTLAECGLNIGDTVTISSGIRAIAQFKDAGNTVLASCDSRGVRTATIPEGTVNVYGILYAKNTLGVVGETIDEELWAQLEIGTSITSFVPFENICPITGWTDCDVTHTGTNIWGGMAMANGIKEAIPQAVLDTSAKTISYASGYATQTNFTSGVRFKENTRYTIILKFSNTRARTNMRVAYTDGTSNFIPTAETGLQTVVYNTAANKTIDFIGGLNSDGTSIFYYEESGLFEGIVTTDDFAPYNGTTYSTALGSTVYGGTLDIVSGELTIDRVIVDFGSLTWTNYKNGGFRAVLSGSVPATLSTDDSRLITTMYRTYASNATLTNGMASIAGGSLHAVNSNYTTDATAFKNGMSGQKAVYKLETPTTTTLTAQQVELLLGANNIWADTGDVTVEFGQNPNILVNPTLFESRPMLEITGYGNINLGSDTISFDGQDIGDIIIAGSTTATGAYNATTSTATMTITIDASLLRAGDAFTVRTRSTGFLKIQTGGTAEIQTPINNYVFEASFAKGTSSTQTDSVSSAVNAAISISYNGGQTVTITNTCTMAAQANKTTSALIEMSDVKAYSTMPSDTSNVYIDLDIGEAWTEIGGEIASLNNRVTMPAELPTLTPGANTITFDNTITGLDIVPRWFKI